MKQLINITVYKLKKTEGIILPKYLLKEGKVVKTSSYDTEKECYFLDFNFASPILSKLIEEKSLETLLDKVNFNSIVKKLHINKREVDIPTPSNIQLEMEGSDVKFIDGYFNDNLNYVKS